MVALLELPRFGATPKLTDAKPPPDEPDNTVSHPVELDAVQLQPVAVAEMNEAACAA